MKQFNYLLVVLLVFAASLKVSGQTLPGDSIVYGPMFSPVYNNSVRVWVLTKQNTGSDNALTLEVAGAGNPSTPLSGEVFNSDDRLGYSLRSFEYTGLTPGETYQAHIKENGVVHARTASIVNEADLLSDFEFLAGGCGRIYDTTRCIDRPESQTHKNGDPEIFNQMSTEGSDLMVWLGDATYLLGLQHAMGQCPDGVDDWANKDMAFDRYMFYRQFHDKLLMSMPQLAITDNHDVGPNEFNKTMPTLGEMRDIFKDWWPNPEYKSTPEGPGLFSSYTYKDVEFFLLDNRSYRDGTAQHLGPDQLAWLKESLSNSNATFKVLISGTPAFAKHWGGRNFSVTAQGDDLVNYIQQNNIDGVLCLSADIHQQELYGRYGDVNYPLFDVLSGNINSDVGDGNYSVDYNSDRILRGVKQTYLRINVIGEQKDRKMKVEYVDLEGKPYFETIIHQDMLASERATATELDLSFTNNTLDSSANDLPVIANNVNFIKDKNGVTNSAIELSEESEIKIDYTQELNMADKAYTLSFWVKPQVAKTSTIFSNVNGASGLSFNLDQDNYLHYKDIANSIDLVSSFALPVSKWSHVAWKYDNVKRSLKLYYNGLEVQSWSNIVSSKSSDASIYVGSDTNGNRLVGGLDEFELYSKLIDDEAIRDNAEYASHRGEVLKLNGAQQMYIPSNIVNEALKEDFTIAFWAKLTSDPGDNFKILSSNGRVDGNSTGISFEYPGSNKLNVVLGNGGSDWTSISEQGDVWNLGEWNHVAFSARKNDKMYYYVNGELVAEGDFSGYVPNNFDGLGLGYSPNYSGAIQAEMDELKIYNTSLTQAQVNKQLHYEITGTNEENLVLYYDFGPYEDHSIISKGSEPFEIELNGAELISGTSPVGSIPGAYTSEVTAYWSKGGKPNNGLSIADPITLYNSNVVIGSGDGANEVIDSIAVEELYYSNIGWSIDPVNVSFATLKVDLETALANYDSITKNASEYYLLQQQDGGLTAIGKGAFDGRSVTFFNTSLEKSEYFIAWKAGEYGAAGRGGALSLIENHDVVIPSVDVNPLLSNSFTIEFWSRLMKDPANNDKLLSNHGRVDNNSTGFSIEVPDDNTIKVVFGLNNNDWLELRSPSAVNVGEWNHIAVTAAPGEWVKLFINGLAVDSAEYDSYVPNENWDLALGESLNYGGETISMMDELRVWSQARTATEIHSKMYSSIKSDDEQLAYNFTFDQENDGSLLNSGVKGGEIPSSNANIVASSAPAGTVLENYNENIAASWSVIRDQSTGLFVEGAIQDYTSNLIVSSAINYGIKPLAQDSFYIAQGWSINALNLPVADLKVDVRRIVNNVDSLLNYVSEFYLLQGDPELNYELIASSKPEGALVTFADVNLKQGVYYLAYKSSPTEAFSILAASDDAEQDVESGHMYIDSSDIELTKDGDSEQLIGLRFDEVNLPQGAIIRNAYIQFTVDEVNTDGVVNVAIGIENSVNSLPIQTFDFDLYHRTMYLGDTVVWQAAPFANVGDANEAQRTPNIAHLLDSVLSNPAWEKGNAVTFLLADPVTFNIPGYSANTSKRVVQTFDKSATAAAKLIVTYDMPDRFINGDFPMGKGALWMYNDNGESLDEVDWTALDFADDEWAYGNATLGYGDASVTTLNYGDDAENKYPTTYLRHVFKVEDKTLYDSLVFDVLRDDGAVVYVNGIEAFRMNMQEGEINYNTLATSAVSGQDEEKYFRVKTANLLNDGLNVIAVELHQAALNSSDLAFDMQIGYEEPPLAPANFPLVKASSWHYLDNGSSLDDVEWMDTSYVASNWSDGEGPLGYGDEMNTVISYGEDASNKFITTYFYRDILIEKDNLNSALELGLRRDDGAIVYINGKEVVRSNMPEGDINYLTTSSAIVDGADERAYFSYIITSADFREGLNRIAVEVHNRDGQSSDLGFDLYLKNASEPNPPVDCGEDHIGCFTSIDPTGQTDKLIISEDHDFQLLFKQGDRYTEIEGDVPGNNDFTAYVPINGSSIQGYLSVNHENTPGGVSMLDIHYNTDNYLWEVDKSTAVDLYNNALVTTTRNCSGGITPWGTVITCEESTNNGDLNGDGYQDVGWPVEIDPKTAQVVIYDESVGQEKLWAMGRMNHENVVVADDSVTVYYGEDGGTHCVYKFVADEPANLSSGKVYVLKLDDPLVADDPSGSTATWVQVPNVTKEDRNNINSMAAALGGTNFNGVEDCEISPIDGKVYFTSKGKGRVYRFKDEGDHVSDFETFVGGRSYEITTAAGVVNEPWRGGNDNLTFDDKGNLWVLQDGDNNYIWVVRPDHTQYAPNVMLFASMPIGSEPTGLTFSPDYKFGFFSVQHPSSATSYQKDATGNDVKFDASATVVFALEDNLGMDLPKVVIDADTTKIIVGQSVTFSDVSWGAVVERTWNFDGGSPLTSNNKTEVVTYNEVGEYTVKLTVTNVIGTSSKEYPAYISVMNPLPMAEFEANPRTVFKGESVKFTDMSTGFPNIWDWSFEGGTPNTSDIQNPTVVYDTPGVYDVSLKVSNESGESPVRQKTGYIEVLDDVTGVDPGQETSVQIYPNPTNGTLTLSFGNNTVYQNAEVEVFNVMGISLFSMETSSAEITIDLNDYINSSQMLVIMVKRADQVTRYRLQFIKN